MMVPSRLVLGMEGDSTGMYGPPSCKTPCQLFSGNQDIGQVLSTLDSDLHNLERGLAIASWRVRHRNGCHVVSSAWWPVGASVSYIRRPSPSRVLEGTGHAQVHSFRHPGFGGGPVDHYKGPYNLIVLPGRFQTRPAKPSHTGFCLSGAEG